MDWTEADYAAWDEDGTLPTGWEMVASIDHGLRPSDETMVLECAYVAAYVIGGILSAIGCDMSKVDAFEAACEAIAPYDGGWSEPTGDDPYCDRVHWLHENIVSYRIWDKGVTGFLVESDGDAGMTWFLAHTTKTEG